MLVMPKLHIAAATGLVVFLTGWVIIANTSSKSAALTDTQTSQTREFASQIWDGSVVINLSNAHTIVQISSNTNTATPSPSASPDPSASPQPSPSASPCPTDLHLSSTGPGSSIEIDCEYSYSNSSSSGTNISIHNSSHQITTGGSSNSSDNTVVTITNR